MDDLRAQHGQAECYLLFIPVYIRLQTGSLAYLAPLDDGYRALFEDIGWSLRLLAFFVYGLRRPRSVLQQDRLPIRHDFAARAKACNRSAP